MSIGCSGGLFGPNNQFIKTNAGDFIAVDGSNIREKLILSDLRIPYKQILKSRIILKPGQVSYLLNHLGLGDNATFLSIKATYDKKSVYEEENFVNWNFYDDFSKIYTFAQMMTLTGNSKNRIKQLYLTNPNTKYSVSLDVMVAIIDDEYSFFNNTINQGGLSFSRLKYTSIITHIVDESIAILSNDFIPVPICYIMLRDIASIEKNSKIIIIDDTSIGRIFLEFDSVYDATQAFSLLELVRESAQTGGGVIIQELNPRPDNSDPIVHFTPIVDIVGGTTYSLPYDSNMGITFSATMSFYGLSTEITKDVILANLIESISDNRDIEISINTGNIIVLDVDDVYMSSINDPGVYRVYFDIVDNAENYVDSNKFIRLTVL